MIHWKQIIQTFFTQSNIVNYETLGKRTERLNRKSFVRNINVNFELKKQYIYLRVTRDYIEISFPSHHAQGEIKRVN